MPATYLESTLFITFEPCCHNVYTANVYISILDDDCNANESCIDITIRSKATAIRSKATAIICYNYNSSTADNEDTNKSCVLYFQRTVHILLQ